MSLVSWGWLSANRRAEAVAIVAMLVAAVSAFTSIMSVRYTREQISEANGADADRVFVGAPTQSKDGRWNFAVRNLNAAPITRVWVDAEPVEQKQVGGTVYELVKQIVIGEIDGCDQVAVYTGEEDHSVPAAVHYTDPKGRRWKRVVGQGPVRDTDKSPSFPTVAIFGSHSHVDRC
jgi:hypothetical protein